MTTRLPLVAAQPGIWMAERLSTLPGAWSVAHYVELRGALDPTLLGKAIVAGLQQADTLSLRFEEEEGEVWQWLAADRTFAEPSIIDLRTAPDPHRAATGADAGGPGAGSARRRRQPAGVPSAAVRRPTTAGTGISDITTCWWMASASRR
ncbi:enterobactin synthase subunit F [Klebsiella pneumoniae]|uniref:Enterobactin synthase subunit F n=1 Tax=Klebsiella pneumoniae TaxID=573 RepID=A0A377Z926_KLEPN|nr:enterobactin synthase subunit F [Klebsiella pneumoniae]